MRMKLAASLALFASLAQGEQPMGRDTGRIREKVNPTSHEKEAGAPIRRKNPTVMGGDGGGTTQDVTCAGKVVCPVGTVATFNTKRMNVPFQAVTIEQGSIDWGAPMAYFAEPYFEQMSTALNAVSQGTVYDRVMAVKKYSNDLQNMGSSMESAGTAAAAYATMVATVVYAVGDMLAQNNIQWRGYFFHVPVGANYVITCQLKGGWDKPNNKVILSGAGTTPIDYHEQLVSDRSKTWQLHLEPGPYYLSVGLGGGSSIVFHTAGTLGSVILTESNPVTFQVPMVLASSTVDVTSLMPNPGDTATVAVRLPTQDQVNALQFPDLLDGSKPTLSPIMPLPIEAGPNIPLLYRQLLETGSNYCFRFIYPSGTTNTAPVTTDHQVLFSLRNEGLMVEQDCSIY